MTSRFVVILFGCVTLAHGQSPSFMQLQGRNFTIDGTPVFLKMINYDMKLISSVDGSTSASDLFVAAGSAYDVYCNNQYECNSGPTCDVQLLKHLNKIGLGDTESPMGYNSMRLWGLSPTFCKSNSGDLTIAYPVHYISSTGFNLSTYWIYLQGPDFQDAASVALFGAIRHVLQLCQAPNIRVMLLTIVTGADGLPPGHQEVSIVHDDEVVNLYKKYLQRLAEELADEPMLFAYDLFNEPGALDQSSGIPYENVHKPKSEVCDATTAWYDAIHAADPDHYVTIGATCKVSDLNSWDPAAMKLDFYSPHVYPGHSSSSAQAILQAKNAAKAEMYWLAANSPMPVIIGETGFSAEDDHQAPLDLYQPNPNGNQLLDSDPAHHQMPWMQGSEAQQADYATTMYQYAPWCLASGLAWWGFQAPTWANLAAGSELYNGNWFGPLKFGNPTGIGPAPFDEEHSWRDKDMVDDVFNLTFAYLPPIIAPRPFNYQNWSAFQGIEIYSLVFKDQYEQSIEEMVCDVTYCWVNQSNANTRMTTHAHYVPDEDGLLSVKAHPNIGAGWYLSWIELDCKILGGPTLRYSGASDPSDGRLPLPWPGTTVHASRDYFGFDHHEHGVVVHEEETRDLRAWNTLHLTDLTAEGADGGGILLAHARASVHLAGDSHIEQGAEAHLWTGPVFADCSYSSFDMIPQSEPRMVSTGRAPFRSLGLTFVVPENGCDFAHASSTFSDDRLFLRATVPNIAYSIADGAGALLSSGSLSSDQAIDVSRWAAGSYILTLYCPEGRIHRKLIKP